MKRAIRYLVAAHLILLSSFNTTMASDLPGASSLSVCEQGLLKGVSKAKIGIILKGGVSVAAGAVSGAGTFFSTNAINNTFFELTDVSTAGVKFAPAKLVISAIASGVVVATIGLTSAYLDYRKYVDTNEGVLLVFRDAKNNGMGPEIEIRAKVIAQILQEVDTLGTFKKFFKINKNYNPETYREENVIEEIVNVSNQMLSSEVIDCKKAREFSEAIDKLVMNNLIKKYNPTLKLKID